ncbi:MAG: hypothetical protein ACI9U2_003084 [Bradymonadia bacterium]|jgi:hypothetical protein
MTRMLTLLALCAGCSNTLNDEGPARFQLDAVLDDGLVDMQTPAIDAQRVDVPVHINEVTAKGDDFIELMNGGEAEVDLSGWAVVDGNYDPDDPDDGRYILPAGATIAPGEFLVLIKDVDHTFGLGDDDAVWLLDADGAIADHTQWADGDADPAWCRSADGMSAFETCAQPTPGASNAGPPPGRCGDDIIDGDERCDGDDLSGLTCVDLDFARGVLGCDADCDGFDTRDCVMAMPVVMLNEMTSSGDDAIELHNAGDAPADLSGWAIADDGYDAADSETHDRLHMLDGALAPGAYRVLIKGVDHTFGLGEDDGVRLFDAEGRIVDQTAWAGDAAAITWCRQPDATGQFMACETATFGAPNGN